MAKKTDKEKAASAKVLLEAFAAHKKKLNSQGGRPKIPKLVGDAPGPKKTKGKGAATSALASEEKRRKARKGNKHAQLGSDEFSPSERAKDREGDKGPSLSRTLTSIAANTKPGTSKAGAAISGALSGAAIGATIDEAGAERKRRAARAKSKEKENGG